MFESSVILEGSKTATITFNYAKMFESSVILEGSKTLFANFETETMFESSVILEGSKTMALDVKINHVCLSSRKCIKGARKSA